MLWSLKEGDSGNTSTDVEKTTRRLQMSKLAVKHLHGRGEDSKIWH